MTKLKIDLQQHDLAATLLSILAGLQAEVAAQDPDYWNPEMREDLDKVWGTLEMVAAFAQAREL